MEITILMIFFTTFCYTESKNLVIDDKFKFRHWDDTPITQWGDYRNLRKIGFDDRKLLKNTTIIQDSLATVPQLIEKYGYSVEIHNTTTSDGYILTLHRITGSKKSPAAPGKKVVLMMHGLLESSAAFVIMGPENSLSYILADSGYDVWLANARGNRYSRKHRKYSPKNRNFWNFSFHEIGKYDLPASIDYVLGHTNKRQLHYVGHSQGTTSFFVMGAERPEYNSKIISMQALAPSAYIDHIRSPLVRVILPIVEQLDKLTSYFGVLEFLPSRDFLSSVGQYFCTDDLISRTLCSNALFLITGFNPKSLNASTIPLLMGHTPAGSSAKQLVHFGQMVWSKKFRQFDYGYFSNIHKYGSVSPPSYDFSKITAPIALYYGDNDYLSAPVDVIRLSKRLPNLIGMYEIEDKLFNHADFLYGIHCKELVYDRVLKIMKMKENEHS